MKACLRWLFATFFETLDLEKKSALAAISWGIWVVCHRSFDSGPAYYYFIQTARWFPYGPEAFWGGIISTAGGVQMFGLLRGSKRLRMTAAFVTLTLWLCLGTAFWLHNARGTGMLIYGLFAYANSALYYQLGTSRRS